MMTDNGRTQETKSKKKQLGHYESKLEKLKYVVIRILQKNRGGVPKSNIWTLVHKETGLTVSAKDYGLKKMARVFEKWTDVIKTEGPLNAEKLFLIVDESSSKTDTASSEENIPADESSVSPLDMSWEQAIKNPPKVKIKTEDRKDFHDSIHFRSKCDQTPTQDSPNIKLWDDYGAKDALASFGEMSKKETFRGLSNSVFKGEFDVNTDSPNIKLLDDKDRKDPLAGFIERSKTETCRGSSNSILTGDSDVDTEDEIEDISSVIDDFLKGNEDAIPDKDIDEHNTRQRPSWINIADTSKRPKKQSNEPVVQKPDQPQINPQMHLNEMPGVQMQNKGNVGGFAPPGMIPQFANMMIPRFGQQGMPFAGMPLTYRLPMPIQGQVGFGVPSINPVPPKSNEVIQQCSNNKELRGQHPTDIKQCESPSSVLNSDGDKAKFRVQVFKDASSHTESESISECSSSISSPDSASQSDQIKIGPIPAWTSQTQMHSSAPGENVRQTMNFPGLTAPGQVRMPPVLQPLRLQNSVNQMTIPFPMLIQGKNEFGRPPNFQSPMDYKSVGNFPGFSAAGYAGMNTAFQAPRPQNSVNEMKNSFPVPYQGRNESDRPQNCQNPMGYKSVGNNLDFAASGHAGPQNTEYEIESHFPMPIQTQNKTEMPSIDNVQGNIQNIQNLMGDKVRVTENKETLVNKSGRHTSVTSQFIMSNLDFNTWHPHADDVKEFIVTPIYRDEFETKNIDVRPVFVPPDKKPSHDQVDSIAKECIEILADANEFVTPERVEQLLLQRFRCKVIYELGFNHVDHIPCVKDSIRLVSKINAYINAFLKARSICTLYELKEALREYVPDKGDFNTLKTGPLQRFPVVYQQFRFPPNQATVPEITSMDILEHFNNYLTTNRLWVNNKLELESFMNYLVKEYSADNAYMLGVRIRSLPLAIGVLKKAKRDSAACHRAIKDHFEENLRTDIEEAFRKFRMHILHSGDDTGLKVRTHYMKMKPEFTIMEIFDKFNVLLTVTQDRRLTRPPKFRRVIEDFLSVMREDDLGKNILHLAICMSNTDVEEAVTQMFFTNDTDNDDTTEGQAHHKPPPQKGALVESLKTYIERCLNAGALSLTHLNRIEEKMIEDFGFVDFSMMGYGRFLEFLLLEETKQIIEESVGLILGAGSGVGESETSFKPNQMDLMEFIAQCKQKKEVQPDHVEDMLLAHYCVKNVRDLGHGSITRLLNYAEKHGKHMIDQFSVYYESALVHNVGLSCSDAKVGILGHQTKDAAKTCLHNCPMLENLADWSHWNLVFEPEHGKLKQFVQKYGGLSTKTLDGGRIVTFDFLALETTPGKLVKIVSSTSLEDVVQALKKRDVLAMTGHLVSMVVVYKGIENMPLALLARHIHNELILIHAQEPRQEGGACTSSERTVGLFILQSLLRIPEKVCISFANQLFLEPLGQVLGSTKSKQILIQLCRTEGELTQLIQLGCLLGIQEWTDVIQKKCRLQDTSVHILPTEAADGFFEDDVIQEDEYIEVLDESDTEDVDEILAGDLVEQEVRVKDDSSNKVDAETAVKVHEDDVVSNEDIYEQDITKKAEENEISPCEAIVNQIRRDEFGVGIQLSEDGQRLMKVQQERLGRSLDRLSKDLYSKDTHFVLELVQNADDNNYSERLLANTTEECPSVKFVIEKDKISVLNNEQGFREKDIRALCDVGRSTKGKHKFGYIGQKGIGFKSVFRITDAPEVHSNGYHIKFDVNSGPMGYILPHWVPEEERIEQNEYMTEIILKLKPDMQQQTRTLAARFNDIHPSLLLFLHRLRHITVENKVENTVQTMRRRDIGNNVVEIQHSHGTERWLVIKKVLDASKISIQTKSGADVESTEIALAFPISRQGKKTTIQRMPPKQPIFAFLPLRSYGFRFIIQGDFDVPSSREDVDRDSSWNQWLRNEIHNVFIDCLDNFKAFPEFTIMDAVCGFLQFVPMEDEVLEFFKPVAADIIKKLKAKQCIPTQPNNEGSMSWKMPSQTVRVRDSLVRSVVTAALLEEHLNLFYLHDDVASRLNPALTSCLGIETLTSNHLFQLGKAIIVEMGTHCNKNEDVVLVSKWMACLYRSLDEFQQDDKVLTLLKSHRLFPLSDGELVSLQDNTVFYPMSISNNKKQSGIDPLVYLQRDVKSIHPMLLKTDDDEVNSQVHKLLLRLGIKQLSPFDVINYHILPVLKTDVWKKKEREVLISYLIYIKEQSEKQASVCNMDDIKEVAMVLTSDGFKNPYKEPVHFSPLYGNQINLKEVFSGYEWAIIDSCYLPQFCPQRDMIGWQNFFRKLGVVDFLAFREKRIQIKRDDLDKSKWKDHCTVWPSDVQEFIVQDFESAEVEGLITKTNQVTETLYADQMCSLFTYIDHRWDKQLMKYAKANVLDKDGKKLTETDSSFGIMLRNSEWLPALETTTSIDEMGYIKRYQKIEMKKSSGLYIKTDFVQSLLFDKVVYLKAPASNGTFCQFLGIKNSVNVSTVKDHLLNWSERNEEEIPMTFCTTLDHMKTVYQYLYSMLPQQDVHHLFQDKPVLFVPDIISVPGKDVVVAGKMLNRREVWLFDKTELFDKHRRLLKEYHSDVYNKRTIGEYYSTIMDTMEIFTHAAKLDMQPKLDEYIQLLSLLCETSSQKETDILHDVLCIFSILGEMLFAPVNVPGGQQAAFSALEARKTFVKEKLKKQKVFPTNKQVWVSLEDNPMVRDNKEFEKMFSDKSGVYFLDMEDKLHKTKPSTKRIGHRNTATTSKIQPDMIDVVIDVCGVKKLSECVDLRPTPEMILPCPEMQGYFSQMIPVLQQYMLAKYHDIYDDWEEMDIKRTLKDAKFYQTRSLEVSYWLPNMTKDTFVIQQEKCFIHPPEFYFHREHLSNYKEVARKIARYFSRGNPDCNNILRFFLNELWDVITTTSEEPLESLLQRYDADNIHVSEEDKWEVEAPIIPEKEKPTGNKIDDNESADAEQGNETEKEEKVFELRAWPPVANPNRTMPTTSITTLASNIWPPPQGTDYMKSVKELPSSFRLIGDDSESRTHDPDFGDDKDNSNLVKDKTHVPVPEHVVRDQKIGVFPLQFGFTDPRLDMSLQNSNTGMSSVSEDISVENDQCNLQGRHINTGKKLVSDIVQQNEEVIVKGLSHEEEHTNVHTSLKKDEEQEQPSDEKLHDDVSTGLRFASRDNHRHSRHYTSEFQEVQRHQGHQTFDGKWQPTSGNPDWNNMATDYTYDNLGTGKDICVMESMGASGDNEAVIGRWGEACVAHYLERQKQLGLIIDYSWKNREEEQGYPFDFEIMLTENSGEIIKYIEVKSTASEDKEVFEISVQQVKFANQMKGDFLIYRVFNAGNPERVKLTRISDLNKRLSAKQVKLFMLI